MRKTVKNLLLGGWIIVVSCGDPADQKSETISAADTAVVTQEEQEVVLPEEPEVFRPYEFQRNRNRYKQDYFRNPFDSAIYVSGTFCELRGNHFHGGLDIRTGGVQGWKVLAAADGYVERIKVSLYGYGKVLYIRHPNGYSTVYGHLKEFKGAIANYVKEQQYDQRKQALELYPPKGKLKVSKGQVIALSGNTGGSAGPHLHFEIRNPRGEATNPLMHGLKVEDRMAPQIKHLAIYYKDRETLYAEGNYPYTVLSANSAKLGANAAVRLAPGTYSLGLHVDDYFTDYNNRLGINYCWVTNNGSLLYEYQIEQFDFTKGRYINTHIDPYLKNKSGKQYIRLFKEQFNPLPYYKQRQNGEVFLTMGDTAHISINVMDNAGHVAHREMVLIGDTAVARLALTAKTSGDKVVRVTKKQNRNVSMGDWSFSFPSTSFYHPFDCKLKLVAARKGKLGSGVQFHYPYTKLHDYVQVSYVLPESLLRHGDKLCAVSYNGASMVYEGGEVRGNKLWFKTRSFGEYGITTDAVSPTIRVLKIGKDFRFRIADNLSGIDQVIVSLDDKWILYDFEPKSGVLWGEIPKWIKPGKHDFKLVVIDSKRNRAEYTHQLNL